MSQDAFFTSVRQAYRSVFPQVTTDSNKIDSAAVERTLRGTDLWLSSKTVEGYDPNDFTSLSPAAQHELAEAVLGFKRIVEGVPPNVPATQAQRDEGWAFFRVLFQLVRSQVLAEWCGAVDALFREVESISEKHSWATKRYRKTLTDSFLGTYELPQLLIHRIDARFLFDPVSRYAPATTGLIDLYVMPSLDGTVLARVNGTWWIHPTERGEPLQSWSEVAFLSVLDRLVRAAA